MSFVLKGEVRLKNPGLAGKVLEDYIKGKVYTAITGAVGQVRAKVMTMVEDSLSESNEFQSIMSGALRQEFGLEEPGPFLNEIKAKLATSVGVFAVKDLKGSLGGMRVEILDYQFERQIASSAAYISVNSRTRKESKVDWLTWLLFGGTSKVVADARLQLLKRQADWSRAGLSIMRSSPIGYSVSPEFAGTSESNWFDKVLAPLGEPILSVMMNEVIRKFR